MTAVIAWVLALVALATLVAIVRWWTRRGHSLVGCLALLATVVAAGIGCIILLARFQSQQNDAGWALMARTADAMKRKQDSARAVQLHTAWPPTSTPPSPSPTR